MHRARELGLVNEIVPGAELLERALAFADRITANAPLAVQVTKQLIWDESRMHSPDEWASIRAKAAPVFASEDDAKARLPSPSDERRVGPAADDHRRPASRGPAPRSATTGTGVSLSSARTPEEPGGAVASGLLPVVRLALGSEVLQ